MSSITSRSILPPVALVCLLEAARRIGLDDKNAAALRTLWSQAGGVRLEDLPDLCRSAGIAARLPPASGLQADVYSYPMIRLDGDTGLLLLEDPSSGGHPAWDPSTGAVTRVHLAPSDSVRLIEISRGVRFAASERRFGFADIARAIDRFWPNTFNVLVLSALLQICAFLGPLFVQFVVDDVIPTFDTHLLAVLLAGFVLISVLQHLTDALRTATVVQFGSAAVYQLMGGMISHLLRLPSGYFENRAPGDVLMRVSAMVSLQDFISRGVVTAAVDGVMALFAAAILFAYSWKLTAIVVTGVVVHSVVTALVQPHSRRLVERQMELSGAEQSHLIETLGAISSVKSAGAESVREDGWLTIQRRVTRVGISQVRLQLLSGLSQKLTSSLQHLLVLYFGALAVMDSTLTLGMLFAFLAFRTLFTDRVTSLINQVAAYRLMDANFARVSDIVDRPEETPRTWKQVAPGPAGLEIENVAYSYGQTQVLAGVTLTVSPGEIVGLTGASGSGKTTLVKLILGLLEPQEGRITAGGVLIRPDTVRQGRAAMASVLQDERLFEGSILENVSFFRRDPDREEAQRALRTACLWADVEQLPDGMDQALGPGGSGLSGGQRQRLTIARALYTGHRILILDEATSSLDAGTARAVLQNLRSQGASALVITHQSGMSELMDKTYVLNGGRVTMT
ncbi:MAG: ATP-binding cassette subfamily B protein RaxB [Brevundimonas sp.]|jgi:ATP-binding cassette subfamily B protein RaxB|uniref:peptidase domain-containing ABC transporter n=1 Tax=Brevundimonas sp. TaxID=1871086 RepID=UPI0039E31FED